MRLGTKKAILGTESETSKMKGSLKTSWRNSEILTQKAQKGTVSLQSLGTTRRFKYRHGGKVYFLTIPAKGTYPLNLLNDIRRGIESDILFGCHDSSQVKYKHWLKSKSIHTVLGQLSGHPSVNKQQILTVAKGEVLQLAEMDVLMLDFLHSSGRSGTVNLYHYTYRMIVNWKTQGKTVDWESLPKLLTEMNYAPETYNNRRYVLNVFCKWLLKRTGINYNPFEDVAAKKKNSVKDLRRQRLTDGEVKDILEAIKNNTFLKANNRGYTHSHYYPIFCFMAYTGCRPAEAIGLKVSKVDLSNGKVTIDAAFARTRKGTSFACRVMKGTKTNSRRDLPFALGGILHQILKRAIAGKKPEDFVFGGPNGPTCDDRALNDSVLKPVCKGLAIPQRILYCFRHSFCSRCFEQGLDIKTIQTLTGHKDVAILLNIYAEVNTLKVKIPNLLP